LISSTYKAFWKEKYAFDYFPESALGQDGTKSPVDVKVGFMATTGNFKAKLLLSPTLQTLR